MNIEMILHNMDYMLNFNMDIVLVSSSNYNNLCNNSRRYKCIKIIC